ncbi:MAG: DUF2281 domain-containing protein [Candidatus Thermoplasmatota archaeon]
MGVRDDLLRELAGVPEPVLRDVLALLRARKRQASESALLAESTLAKDWLRPEEDAAWKDL